VHQENRDGNLGWAAYVNGFIVIQVSLGGCDPSHTIIQAGSLG